MILSVYCARTTKKQDHATLPFCERSTAIRIPKHRCRNGSKKFEVIPVPVAKLFEVQSPKLREPMYHLPHHASFAEPPVTGTKRCKRIRCHHLHQYTKSPKEPFQVPYQALKGWRLVAPGGD